MSDNKIHGALVRIKKTGKVGRVGMKNIDVDGNVTYSVNCTSKKYLIDPSSTDPQEMEKWRKYYENPEKWLEHLEVYKWFTVDELEVIKK